MRLHALFLAKVHQQRLEMANKKIVTNSPTFKPLITIPFVSEGNITIVSPTIELVGEKAFGLSCLPKKWTLPFVVVSEELLSLYKNSSSKKSLQLIKGWSKIITKAVLSVGVSDSGNIIVRSSGCSEGLDERGKFYSCAGTLDNLIKPLTDCLEKLASDEDITTERIPLIIQKHVIPISGRGHLSNERRFYKEKRDWICDFEERELEKGSSSTINLRNWRKKHLVYIDKELECNLSAHILRVLKIAAAWAYERKLRLHIEWVWDGNAIYLVQADQEHKTEGVDPTKYYRANSIKPQKFTPKCLKQINSYHAQRYNKIRNVFKYLKLGLHITKLYILEDERIIKDLVSGNIAPELEEDLAVLVKGSLVIRTDIANADHSVLQMLPRTHEVRDLGSALKWLKDESSNISKNYMRNDFVFIFHNFVQAAASAFAYAVPGERKVQIEALWGLPEGLYYNSHDKYVVDTKTKHIDKLNYENLNKFEIRERINYKRFFVAPDENGRWTSKILKPNYDWKGTIAKEEWIKEIALDSRRITEEEGIALSIMWFVDVSDVSCLRKVMPWYHEHFDILKTSRSKTHRTKTPFDKSLTIRTNDDIGLLRKEVKRAPSSVRRIRIQPQDEKLLRNKDALRDIGKLSKEIDAIILLEGGVLSHAYYQLLETNAIVEVLHPFDNVEDKREFNKLVRDKVVDNIKYEGEIVNSTQLSGEHLLRALKEKLIEESFEVLDAIDSDSIVDELADVSEVIDGILSNLDESRDELLQRQKQKREKAGGFKDGTILLETKNPIPTSKETQAEEYLLEEASSDGLMAYRFTDGSKVIEGGHKIDKSSDRREHKAATEVLLRLVIPMVRDNWNASAPKITFDLDSKKGVQAKITGKRMGAKIQLELSIYTQQNPKQLLLFDQEHIQKYDDEA